MNKRMLSYIIAILVICSLTGCKKEQIDQNAAEPTQSNTEAEADFDTNTPASENPTILVETQTDQIPADQDPEQAAPSKEGNKSKRIVCYGDSLTEGYGGDGTTMPGTLEHLSGATVLNYGVYAEPSSAIAARQGANPQYLTEDITIPADCTPVKAQPSGKYGYEMLVNFGVAGLNNCFIAGIEGTYSITDDGERQFTRLTPGEETFVPAGTQIITHAMADKRPDDIMVIWAGSNDVLGTADDIPDLIQKLKEMVEYHGNDEYIIISLTSRHSRIAIVDDVNAAIESEFKEHYLNLRDFIVNDSLAQLGITPTAHDLEAISKGDVPFSIRLSDSEDENHGNADFYRLAGEQVYKKCVELGYLE